MVRRALGIRRVGHVGTLDPFATGLLLVLIGGATRLARFLVGFEKRYTGTVRLGVTTDTMDHTGAVVGRCDAWETVSDERIDHELAGMVGPMRQRPPVFSAKKVRGLPAHRRTRRGESVEVGERDVHVHELVRRGRSGSALDIETRVSSGTYVRALADELGRRLECGAHLETLRRITVGPFSIEEAIPIDRVNWSGVRPALQALPHLPDCPISLEERQAVRHGRPVTRESLGVGPVVLVADDQLVAVAEPTDGILRPRVVLES